MTLVNRIIFTILVLIVIGTSLIHANKVLNKSTQVDLAMHITATKLIANKVLPTDFINEYGYTSVRENSIDLFQQVNDQDLSRPSLYTPTLFSVMLPFIKIPIKYSKVIWFWFCYTVWILTILILLKVFSNLSYFSFNKPKSKEYFFLFLSALVLNSKGSLVTHLINGQTAIPVLFFFLISTFYAKTNYLKGFLLAIAFSFKFHCLLFYIAFIGAKRIWKPIAYMVIFLSLFMVPYIFFDFNPFTYIYDWVYHIFIAGGSSDSPETKIFPATLLNISFVLKNQFFAKFITSFVLLFFFLYTFIKRKVKIITLENLLLISVITLLPVYHRLHDSVLFMAPLYIMAVNFCQNSNWKQLIISTSFIIFFSLPSSLIIILSIVLNKYLPISSILTTSSNDSIVKFLSKGIYQLSIEIFPWIEHDHNGFSLYGVACFLLFLYSIYLSRKKLTEKTFTIIDS
jgi:hypothetical protein